MALFPSVPSSPGALCKLAASVSIRQHTSQVVELADIVDLDVRQIQGTAYVSIRQNASAYVSIRQQLLNLPILSILTSGRLRADPE